MSARGAEVVIVGAGPAGAALALRLARAGREVLVVESARFPRDKPCGDCLNPGAVAELGRLGLTGTLRAALRPQLLSGWRVEAPDGRAMRALFAEGQGGEPLVGWAVRRREFDAALLREAVRAGASVVFGVRVFDLAREGGRVCGVRGRQGTEERAWRASLVVGADGLRSVVQRRAGLAARPPALRKIALVGHLAGRNGCGGLGELHVRGGRTCGYVRLPAGGNVTLVVPWRESTGLRGRPREFFCAALSDFPAVFRRVVRAGLEEAVLVTGPFDRPVLRPWAPGVMLVGDAAGYYDPFTGQGIHQALCSARLAAGAIESILEEPEAERRALRAYARRLRGELVFKRALQRAIEAVISRPAALSRLLAALSAGDGAPARRLLRVSGDVTHPLVLLDPFLWTRLAYALVRNRG